MKRLPLGIQTFSKLILDNHYYVDKTEFISKLANIGSFFFLSRPRRFVTIFYNHALPLKFQ